MTTPQSMASKANPSKNILGAYPDGTLPAVNVRVAGASDLGAIAALRAQWGDGAAPHDPEQTRAGFLVADDAAGDDRLLVRPGGG